MSGTPATPEVDETENISNRPDETEGIDDNSIPGEEAIDLEPGGFHIAPSRGEPRSILTKAQIEALGAGFINSGRVKDLRGNSYLQAWDVKATLIKVFGWGGFSTEVLDTKVIAVREYAAGTLGHVNVSGQNKDKPRTPQAIVMVTMRLTLHNIGPAGQDVVFTEVAVGTNSQWDIGEAVDTATKTAESDALKRCAIFLGTQFGLSLYNNGSTADVVRKVLVPWQGKILDERRAAAATAAGAQARADLARATGAKS